MFAALALITEAARQAGIESVMEAAIRGTQYHSAADGSLGDAVLIGVSRIEQLAAIMNASRQGPLPEAVVQACERGPAI